jgi:GNAT superfamily N-acetyltransferase
MRDLPPGWATDLAVLEHSGSMIEDHGDHLLVRTPHNPSFHWGHCVLVTDETSVDEAGRWVGTFAAAFPLATWVAIGLARMPDDRDAWAGQGLELGLDDVLTTRCLPRQTPVPHGYAVRRLRGDDDWEQCVVRALAENEATAEFEPRSHQQFVRARTRAQRALSEREVAAFFGAFADDKLVADLGIVCCGTTARYQNVGTDRQHRRRGLACHLLGVAARWAADHGCNQWVIVTEATNPAGRVYRAVGFEQDTATVQAYRPPAH